MHYVSTRGGAKAAFVDVLLGGPAPDGGLYLPEEWPHVDARAIAASASLPYAEIAYRVMRPFIGDAFTDAEFRADVEASYAAFHHAAIVPLVQTAPNQFLLELFHGPTLAFKDVAMQLLGRLFARALKKLGRRATVIVATSGDTGSAAIAALRGRENIDVVVLHPKGRVSEVQRRQMTTADDANVHNIALEGTFDDTQSIVKALFADAGFVQRTQLTAVNSINFARIMAQAVYYFTAASALGAGHGRRVNFVVPTGNFGDIFAGEAAARMGLPVERLVVATNANNIMARTLATGTYAAGQAIPTLSPSMDIQIASNFERALFEASGRDAPATAQAMAAFASDRNLDLPVDALAALRARYRADAADDDETIRAIARIYGETGHIIDPHTAVAIAVAEKIGMPKETPAIVLATAHPAKFPDAVERAIGIRPSLPPALSNLMQRDERYTVLPNATEAVRNFVLERTKAA